MDDLRPLFGILRGDELRTYLPCQRLGGDIAAEIPELRRHRPDIPVAEDVMQQRMEQIVDGEGVPLPVSFEDIRGVVAETSAVGEEGAFILLCSQSAHCGGEIMLSQQQLSHGQRHHL